MNPVNLTFRVGPTVPSGLASRLLRITRSLDPNLRVEQFRPLDEVLREILAEKNIFGFALGIFMIVVLLFSAAGIHTLVAFAVAQRRRAIGIRSALAAPPLRLVTDVFRRDLSLVVAGGIVGALLSYPIGNYFLSSTDGVSVTVLSASAALLFVTAIGLLAVAAPARRTLRIDETEALRET